MRLVKWMLVAGWFALHGWLWALLPTAPFALNGRLPCVLRCGVPLSYIFPHWGPWSRGELFSHYNNFAFVEGGHELVAGDATSVHIYNPATREVRLTWDTGVTGQYPENGVRVWGVSADGTYAVMNNGDGAVWLLNLVSGVREKLAGSWGTYFRAEFTADPGRRLNPSGTAAAHERLDLAHN